MSVKKPAAKSPRTPAPRAAVEADARATRPKVTRRRVPAAAPVIEAAAGDAPIVPRPTARVRKAPAVTVATEAKTEIAPVPARQVTDEDIRVRAYFLALESQGRGGSVDYWLRAERELRANAASTD